jgi:hypothetical protein
MRSPIGGFFELEIAAGSGPFHGDSMALWSGRACLRQILQTRRPSRAWAPFYICDAALEPFASIQIPVERYSLDEALEPKLPAGAMGGGECLLYVNYFGLKTSTAASLVAAHPHGVIVDDTQAFFSKGYPGGWSFNSARKFFGVPDGGYAYGPGLRSMERPRVPEVRYDHLVNRLLGRQELAYEQYVRSEACVTSELWRMSVLSERLLASIDYPAVRDWRRRNFAALHLALGGRNRLKLSLEPSADEVPFCYPLLSSEPVPWESLWDRGVFAPKLWPELAERLPAQGAEWESMLAERLVPLPIDHRYGLKDVDRLVEVVAEVLGW